MLFFYPGESWLLVYIPLQQFAIALFWPTSASVVSNSVGEDMQRSFYLLQELGVITDQFGEKELSGEINAKLSRLISVIQPEKGPAVPK